MKKTLHFLIACIIIFYSMMFSAFADLSIDEELVKSIKSNIPQDEMDILNNPDYYDSSMAQISLDNKLILKCYSKAYFELAYLPMNDIVERISIKQGNSTQYIVIDNNGEAFKICIFKSNDYVCVAYLGKYDYTPTYLKDIKKLNSQTTFNGEKCFINNIICFEDSQTHTNGNVLIYFDTDKGNYIKAYQRDAYGSVLFHETDFESYATSYSRFIVDPKYWEVDANGPRTSFLEFVDYIYDDYHYDSNIYTTDFITEPNSDTNISTTINKSNSSKSTWLWLIPPVAVILICGGITTFIIIRKKRKLKINTDNLE